MNCKEYRASRQHEVEQALHVALSKDSGIMDDIVVKMRFACNLPSQRIFMSPSQEPRFQVGKDIPCSHLPDDESVILNLDAGF